MQNTQTTQSKTTEQPKAQTGREQVTYRNFSYRDKDGSMVYGSAQVNKKAEKYNGIDI